MQKNIAKLVTVSGGTPTKKADSFFSSSKFRENQYEAQFNKGTKPTKVEEKEKSSGGFLGMISSLASGIMSVISSAVSAVGNSIGSLSGLFTGLGIAVAGIGVAFSRVLGFLAKSPVGRLLGLVGLSVAASKAMAGTTKTPGEAGNPTTESNASGLNQSVIDTAAGVGGAIAATGIIGGASKLLTAGSQTKTAILDAKTTPSNISYKDKTPTTKWGKFLAFVERVARERNTSKGNEGNWYSMLKHLKMFLTFDITFEQVCDISDTLNEDQVLQIQKAFESTFTFDRKEETKEVKKKKMKVST